MGKLSGQEWVRSWRIFAAHAMPSSIPLEAHAREQIAKRAAEMADVMMRELEARVPDALPDPQ